MPTTPDWRDAESYDYTTALDPAGWAWEFLRRNPDYRADYQRCRRARAEGEADASRLEEEASRRWGPRCPGRPRPRRGGRDHRLAARV